MLRAARAAARRPVLLRAWASRCAGDGAEVEKSAALVNSGGKKRKLGSSISSISSFLVGSAAGTATLGGVKAVEIFLDCMGRQGNPDGKLSKAGRGRARAITDWFRAFATPAEVTLLLPPAPGQPPHETGAQRRLAAKLQRLVVARLTAAFVAGGAAVPLGLKPKKVGRDVVMKASTIETQLKTLTKNNVVVLVDPAAFAAFRVTHEAAAIAAVAAEPMEEGDRTPL